MPQIVDPRIFEPSALSDALPRMLGIGQVLAWHTTGDHKRVVVVFRNCPQERQGGLTDRHEFCAGLRRRQSQDTRVKVNASPFQGLDLAKATAGEDQ